MTERHVPLGAVAEFINGAAFKPEDWGDDGFPIIRIQNLTDSGKPFNRTQRRVNTNLYVQPGDILVSWSATLGVFVWIGPETAVLNQHIFRVVPDPTKVEKSYLRHALEGTLQAMQRHLHGATMQHVNRGEFLATPFFLPPLPEQRRIAAILDQAHALKVKRREALEQLDSLAQSIFIEMFGDPISNPKKWTTCALDRVCEKITDGTHKTPVYVDSGVEFLSAKDLKDERIVWGSGKCITTEEHVQLIKRCNPERGDVLLAKSGSLGAVALVDRDHEFSLFESLCLIKHARNKIVGQYLVGLLRSPSMLAHVLGKNKGIAIKHLHLVDVRSLEIPVPPIDLQETYAKRIGAVELVRGDANTALLELDTLFTSLQHRAFRGDL